MFGNLAEDENILKNAKEGMTLGILSSTLEYLAILGRRVTDDFAALIGGRYGRLPVQPEPMFLKQILGDTLPISHRPADTIENAVEKYRSMVAPYAEQDEDLLTLAMFEDVAKHYFELRKKQKYNLDSAASSAYAVHPV